MQTMTERRRNQFSGHCGVCRCEVGAGEGWLYAAVNGSAGRRGARFNRRGGFAKFVKCDRCHSGGFAHAWQLPENKPAPKPALPKLGVAELRAGKLEFTREKWGNWTETLARWTLADGRSAVVCFPRAITCEPQTNPITDYFYGDRSVFDSELTPAAKREFDAICERCLPLYAAHLEAI